MSNLSNALKQELQELDTALRSDPRYRRMRMIRELLADYEPGAKIAPTVIGELGPATPTADTERANTKGAKIKHEITSLLTQGATHRTVILDHLIKKGLMGHEKKPIRSLAIYLSQAEEFGNDGSGNWFLKPKNG